MGRSSFCGSDGLRKGAWTTEEDHKLVSYIKKHGEGGWRFLPQKAGLQRCGKSCRLRWANYLKPGIKRGGFTPEEDQIIFQLHAELGNRWAAIARHLPNRTDNEIKNYWNAHLKKRLANMGVDLATAGGASSSSSGTSDDTGCAKPPQQSEQQPTTQRSASALLLNKLATRVTQCIGAQTLQLPTPFNDNGCAENPDFFGYQWSSCTVPETSDYWAGNNDTDSLVVLPESGNSIDERPAGVLNDIMASEFASLSCVDELNDWLNNDDDDDNTIGSEQIQVDNHSDSTTVGFGLWDDNVIVDDDIIFDTVGSLGF